MNKTDGTKSKKSNEELRLASLYLWIEELLKVINSMLPMSQLLLQEYRDHYIFEKERITRSMETMDEVQRRANAILLEMIDFEILDVQEELDLYLANKKA